MLIKLELQVTEAGWGVRACAGKEDIRAGRERGSLFVV